MTEDMQIELGDALAALGSGQVRLQRHLDKADTKIAQQDAKIALQQRLIDSHEHLIEMLEMMLRTAGAKSDA